MDLEKLEKLIKLVKDNDVKKIKYKDFEDEVELDFTDNTTVTQGVSQSQSTQAVGATTDANQGQKESNTDSAANSDKEIKSPMVGTFFLQDSKELSEPIIQVGDTVKQGDVVGYVEAMKVFNEITSDVDGEVAEIVVEHGTNVEYDQVLVRLK